ncbi:capsule polysaccharide export protein, partial [Oceanicella sp. SM1341]|uniref:capsule polysaccharide export protein n=1 Tax=Oceanicella sp. SM1341 TaxID=1548889 RepID=UPI000E46F726
AGNDATSGAAPRSEPPAGEAARTPQGAAEPSAAGSGTPDEAGPRRQDGDWARIRQEIAARRQAELRAREEQKAAAASGQANAASGPASGPAPGAEGASDRPGDTPPVSRNGESGPARRYEDDDDDDDDLPRPRVTAERRDLTVVPDRPLTSPAGTEVGAPAKPRNKPRNAKPAAGRRPRRLPAWLMPVTFVLLVLLPAAIVINYLYEKAADQYHSVVAFSVRSEEAPSVSELGVSLPTVTGPSDSDILYEFIQSQQMVETLQGDLDLRAIYNKRPDDEIFAFGTDHPIEDLVDYWNWATTVDYDSTTGLIEVTALAFTPEDAQNIAQGVLDESSQLINSLSTQAREDAISYARTDVEEAQARLREIRLKLRQFRDREQTADPTQDVEVQMALLTALQQNLAQALIDRAELTEVTSQNDPRIAQADRRIRAVEQQIAEEKAKIGNTSEDPDRAVPLASTVGEFEELKTDLGFAEEAYVTAQKAFDEARIEARRQSRYLAPHIQPTFSQQPQYPQRLLLSALTVGALIAIWGVLMLLVVNVTDRR